ncbi:MAG TPA: ATP-binding protein [Terriglobales bacterium]|nr:ATP-binding protein [Terriglobales bacterium]
MKLQNLSIKRKLMLITMLTSSVALLLSSASFLTYDLISFRHLLTQDLETQAQIIGYNSAAAMAFRDEPVATATLAALKAKEDIVAAVLYTPDGKIFAQYVPGSKAAPAVVPPNLSRAGYRFEGGYFDVLHDVNLNGEHLGTLLLRSDMREWSLRAKRYALIFFVFVFASGLFALLLSSKLQRMISRPILQLEDTIRIVSANKNYEIRAANTYGDEIGRLMDGFNNMLAEIQQRDTALLNANDQLHARTEELEREVAQRQEAQEELLKAKHAAEEASRAKSAFLANMSHELRTPLNAIIGYSEMLEEETRESGDTEAIQDLQKIQTAGKHLLSLINDVLDLSKIEAGKMTLHLETFDVPPMIRQIVSTLEPAAAKNSNVINVRIADSVGSMRADVTKVRQILVNLVSNACKFTDSGIISVNVEPITAEGQELVRFEVRDTGIGITAKQRQQLFQEFAQADTSISRKYGGTGLGLAISHRFAQMMSGQIHVESEPGRGSTFTVLIPVEVKIDGQESPSSDMPSEAAQPQLSDNVNQDTILVIDDEATCRELMSRSLSKLGLRVIATGSGEEGIELARRVRPLLITLDVLLPDRDGWSVLHELKTDPELSSIPVIMLTIIDNEAMALSMGASNYLVKPLDRERLAVLIEKYRNSRSSSNSLNPNSSSRTTEKREQFAPAAGVRG